MSQEVAYRYDIFVIYNDSDLAWVEGYLLPELGLPLAQVMTVESFTPGAVVIQEYVRAITQSRFTLLVLSEAFLTERWSTFGGQLAAHLSVSDQQNRLIPIRLTATELPLQIDFRVALDCTEPVRWSAATARLRAMLNQTEPQAAQIPCPYPGLTSFTEAMSGYFFGREEEVERLRQCLQQKSSATLIGPSGVGKSSLLQAGLIPALRQTYVAEGTTWRVLTVQPGAQPLRSLAMQVAQHLPGSADAIATELLGAETALVALLQRIAAQDPPVARIVLIVDQLEQLFVGKKEPADGEMRDRFLRLLEKAMETAVERCFMVLAVRSDFYGECQTSILWPQMRRSLVDLAPMTPSELHRAIVRPAQAVGVYLEPALVERLVVDATGARERGALPLLQDTLVSLWNLYLRRRLLTLTDYNSLGSNGQSGLQTILRRRADSVLTGLDEEQRTIVRRIFLRLVEFGEGRRDVRRQQPLEALSTGSTVDTDLRSVLELLVNNGLLSTDRDPETGAVVVDLAHEMIIDAWPRLEEWLDSYQAMEMMRRSLVLAAVAWRENNRDESYLFTSKRLTQATEWAAQWPTELGTQERDFLMASELLAAQRRRRQRLIRWALAVVTTALVVLLIGWATNAAWREWVRRTTGTMTVPIKAGSAQLYNPATHAWRTVTLASFQIETYEVSNHQYQRCVDAGPCSRPEAPEAQERFNDPARANYPVVGVNARQANVYCRWLRRRLPTQVEWERAGRGVERRRWPWGDTPARPGQVQMFLPDYPDIFYKDAVPVNSMSDGATPDGIHHLVGNVAEWVVQVPADCTGASCQQPWDGVADLIGIMGGAFQFDLDNLSDMTASGAGNADEVIGFRCVEAGSGR